MCLLNTLIWGYRPLEAGMGVLILDGGLIFGWTSQVFWTRDAKKQDIYDEMIYSDSTEAEGEFNLGLFAEKRAACYWNIC